MSSFFPWQFTQFLKMKSHSLNRNHVSTIMSEVEILSENGSGGFLKKKREHFVGGPAEVGPFGGGSERIRFRGTRDIAKRKKQRVQSKLAISIKKCSFWTKVQ